MIDKLKLLGILLFTGMAAGVMWADTTVKENLPAEPDGLVAIENLSGSITVTGWDEAMVAVHGVLEDDVKGLDISTGPSRVDIRVEIPRERRNLHETDAELEIQVPRASRLMISCLSADVDLSGLSGSLRVETVSGDLQISADSEEVEIKTISGDAKVSVPAGRVLVEAVSGDVDLKGVSGEVSASTISGDLEIRGKMDVANIQTTSGDFRFEGDFLTGGRITINSLSGDVSLVLPFSVSAEFQVSTFSGEIENQLGPAAVRKSKHGPGRELKFSSGRGSAKVEVESFSGEVRIRRQDGR